MRALRKAMRVYEKEPPNYKGLKDIKDLSRDDKPLVQNVIQLCRIPENRHRKKLLMEKLLPRRLWKFIE